MIRVAVVGSAGRMGQTVCDAVDADDECELVARVGSTDSLEAVVDAGADVAVEFTVPDSVARNACWLLERGVHTVVGATGMDADDLEEVRSRTGPANCIVAPNFAIGAVLAMRFAEQAARHLPHAEVIEAHHPAKLDAPSGTARRTAELIAAARHDEPAVPGPDGEPSRGNAVEGVPVHALRLPGVVASQEALFGAEGQTLSIRHDALDRSAFMPGVLLAVKRIAMTPGLTIGLEHLLD